jgi:hypothetical protein
MKTHLLALFAFCCLNVLLLPTQNLAEVPKHQCESLTQKGARCRRNALEGRMYCAIHNRVDGPMAAGRCLHYDTVAGQCPNGASAGRAYCIIHFPRP